MLLPATPHQAAFKSSYYAIADSIESMRDLPLGDNFTALLLDMRMKLEQAGRIAQKELGAWD